MQAGKCWGNSVFDIPNKARLDLVKYKVYTPCEIICGMMMLELRYSLA